MPQPRFYAVPLTIVVAVATSLAAAPVLAQSAATFAIALPAQPLGSALNELARQASFQLIFHPDLVAGRNAPAVSGSLSAQQALERLLAGSGLQALQEGRVVVVKAAPKADTVTLSGVSVTASAERETPTGPVIGGHTRLVMNADTGALPGLWLPTGAAAGDMLSTWLATLHMAAMWGWPLQLLVCLLGLAVTALSVTGVHVWLRKRRAGRLSTGWKAHLLVIMPACIDR